MLSDKVFFLDVVPEVGEDRMISSRICPSVDQGQNGVRDWKDRIAERHPVHFKM
jgi:hypothetical protein